MPFLKNLAELKIVGTVRVFNIPEAIPKIFKFRAPTVDKYQLGRTHGTVRR
jgi:hypothetical protein